MLEAQVDFLKAALEHERSRADRERERADELISKEIASLRAVLDQMRRSWWRRLLG